MLLCKINVVLNKDVWILSTKFSSYYHNLLVKNEFSKYIVSQKKKVPADIYLAEIRLLQWQKEMNT